MHFYCSETLMFWATYFYMIEKERLFIFNKLV